MNLFRKKRSKPTGILSNYGFTDSEVKKYGLRWEQLPENTDLLRDQIAIAAMTAIISNEAELIRVTYKPNGASSAYIVANDAYVYAEAMIEERKKRNDRK